jgi:hypothetical protein
VEQVAIRYPGSAHVWGGGYVKRDGILDRRKPLLVERLLKQAQRLLLSKDDAARWTTEFIDQGVELDLGFVGDPLSAGHKMYSVALRKLLVNLIESRFEFRVSNFVVPSV